MGNVATSPATSLPTLPSSNRTYITIADSNWDSGLEPVKFPVDVILRESHLPGRISASEALASEASRNYASASELVSAAPEAKKVEVLFDAIEILFRTRFADPSIDQAAGFRTCLALVAEHRALQAEANNYSGQTEVDIQADTSRLLTIVSRSSNSALRAEAYRILTTPDDEVSQLHSLAA